MQLELLPGRREREHLIVQALERRARLAAGAGACRRARRACRPARRAGRRRTAARRRPSCVPRRAAPRGSRAPRAAGARAASRATARAADPSGSSAIARRIAWMRADLTFEMPPGRIASSTSATGASRTASHEGSACAAAGRRRRGCGRWSTARAPSARARRSDGRAGASAARRRPRAGGRERARRARATAASTGRPPRSGAEGSAIGRRHGTRITVSGAPAAHISSRGARGERPRRRDRRAAGVLAQRVLRRAANGAAAATAGTLAPEAAVPLYLHGVPNNSDDWLAFLARSGGLAPDLPGFGRSGKPGSLRFTIDEYAGFLERFLELVGRRAREPRRARLGRRRPGLRPAPPRARRAAGGDQRRALPARLPLAPHGAHLAHAGARRAGDGHHQPPRPAAALEGVQRDSRADAPGLAGQRARPLRPGHPARDPAPLPQLAAGRARGGRRAPGRAADARARRVGHEGSLHPRRASAGPTPTRSATPSCWSSPTRATGRGWTGPT